LYLLTATTLTADLSKLAIYFTNFCLSWDLNQLRLTTCRAYTLYSLHCESKNKTSYSCR